MGCTSTKLGKGIWALTLPKRRSMAGTAPMTVAKRLAITRLPDCRDMRRLPLMRQGKAETFQSRHISRMPAREQIVVLLSPMASGGCRYQPCRKTAPSSARVPDPATALW
jgi:hypothetical protein